MERTRSINVCRQCSHAWLCRKRERRMHYDAIMRFHFWHLALLASLSSANWKLSSLQVQRDAAAPDVASAKPELGPMI